MRKLTLACATAAIFLGIGAARALSQTYPLHKGEVGKQILYFPNPPAPAPGLDLHNLSVKLIIQPPSPASAIVETMTVEGSGTSCPDSNAPRGLASEPCATYLTIATDLPVAGGYLFQWSISSDSSVLWYSDAIPVQVGGAL